MLSSHITENRYVSWGGSVNDAREDGIGNGSGAEYGDH
jgi:hypothetical protein